MPILRVTTEELQAATLAVFGLDPQHAPNDVWIDHFDEGHSYVRAAYRQEFCRTCARRLLQLVKRLRFWSGNDPTITVVIYVGDVPEDMAERRQEFVRNRLDGLAPPGP